MDKDFRLKSLDLLLTLDLIPVERTVLQALRECASTGGYWEGLSRMLGANPVVEAIIINIILKAQAAGMEEQLKCYKA